MLINRNYDASLFLAKNAISINPSCIENFIIQKYKIFSVHKKLK